MRGTALLALCFTLISCSEPSDKPPYPEIDGNLLKTHWEKFTAIESEGRTAGSKGEGLAASYVEEVFTGIGLKVSSQSVPLVEIKSETSPLRITGSKSTQTLNSSDGFVAWSKQGREAITVDAELVFVGYGIVAPEYGWNDFKGTDLKGKILVVLIGDPHNGSSDLMGLMGPNYYGRDLYKFEEAARQGAAGVFIVYLPKERAYSWEGVQASRAEGFIDLDEPNRARTVVPVEGWITEKVAAEITKSAGFDFEDLKKKAELPNFTPLPLGVRASIDIKSSQRSIASRNVIGLLEGRGSEYIVYASRWNHLEDEDAVEPTGLPILMEVARALTRETVRLRSYVFMALTAEDEGLLGAEHYTKNPLFPIEKTMAYVNFSDFEAHYVPQQVYIIGNVFEALQDILKLEAAEQYRVVSREHEQGRVNYYRGGQFNWTEKRVPSMYFTTARPHEELPMQSTTMAGGELDARMLFDLGRILENSSNWPQLPSLKTSETPRNVTKQ